MLTDDSEFAIAHEIWAAAQLAQGEGIEDGANRIAAILARIDAERGKGAVAIVDFSTDGWRELVDALKAMPDGTPLFLATTIPPGCALVRIEPTQAMIAAGINTPLIDTGDDTVDQQADYRAVWKSMIAAAQGERNATD